MSLKKCQHCGKIFLKNQSYSKNLCNQCFKEDRRKFKSVRDYLWDNYGASVNEIAQNTEVSEKTIRRFIREGRLKEI